MIRLSLRALVLGLFATAIAPNSLDEEQQQPLKHTSQEIATTFKHEETPLDWKQQCKEHRITAYQTEAGDVHFGPQTHGEHPSAGKVSGINLTSWEQWVFDSVSDDGSSGVFLSLGRDASYSFFGQGNLHVEFYALLEDGTSIQELAFVDESTVFDCGAFVYSSWTSRSHSFEFRVPRDTKAAATFSVSTPKLQGSFVLLSLAPGHAADGSSQVAPGNSSSVAPGLHMHGTIPAATVQGNLTVRGRGNSVSKSTYAGMGGHLHLWAIDNWFKIVWGFTIIRAAAGPYSFFYWAPTSRIGGRVPHYTAVLFKDGKKLVSAHGTALVNYQGNGNNVAVSATQHGRGARASVAGRSTGHVVEFRSSGQEAGVGQGHWRFIMEHQHVQVQMPFGQGTGLAVFTNRVFGGEVGGCQYLGSAFSEEAEFPEALAQWKIWLVYGIGMLNQVKARLGGWLDGLYSASL